MGNCQAIDAATLVIQHPSGREEKLYWPVTANEVMKTNPGHYVALLIATTTLSQAAAGGGGATTTNHPNNNTVRFTRIKLLRPTDTLALGQVYRLITNQEVMKVLCAKKHSKMKKKESESAERVKENLGSPGIGSVSRSEFQKTNQVTKHQMHRQRTSSSSSTAAAAEASANSATAKSKTWQPSLQSISEAGS